MRAATSSAGLASAAPALATTSCTEIFGSGSSLQGIAQTEVWVADWPGCTGGSITYTATTTSDGLEEFGDIGTVLQPAEDPTANPTLDAYVAVDNAPTAGELGEAKAAEGGKQITIPVAHAPVSVLLSLPAKCTVTGGANIQIPTDILEEVWYGTLEPSGTYAKDTWGALLKQSYSSGKSPRAPRRHLRELAHRLLVRSHSPFYRTSSEPPRRSASADIRTRSLTTPIG